MRPPQRRLYTYRHDSPAVLIEVPTVITTHQNADFDALAAAVGRPFFIQRAA